MKKYISIGLALTLVCALLAGCGTTSTTTTAGSTNTINNDTEIVENTTIDTSTTEVVPPTEVFSLAGEIVELGDSTIIVKRLAYTTEEEAQNFITIKYDYSKLNLSIGNIVKAAYKSESETNEVTDVIDITLVANNLEEFENPPSVSEIKSKEWGIQMTVENVTPSGLTLVCNQTGGENIVELNTSSFYNVQVLKDGNYVDVNYILEPNDIAWTSEAYIVALNDTTTWDINWETLYGKLPVGQYRIAKEIINFKGVGQNDEAYIFVDFEITE